MKPGVVACPPRIELPHGKSTYTCLDFPPAENRTCKFPMIMLFVLILHRRCRSKTNFNVFSYDKICLKFCASLRFFIAVFMKKFQTNPFSELYEKRNWSNMSKVKLNLQMYITSGQINIPNLKSTAHETREKSLEN